ncbi:MAG: branched-chain amino acid transaminase [Firmicutes bacterium]|nr:branched-chain amino acid transaminase [Bacillota bacterium]
MGEYAYFQGQFVPIEEAKISIKTHAFLYGTGVFEGIRAYWNEDDQQLYVFRLLEHFQRLERSGRIFMMKSPLTVEEMVEVTVELLRKNQFKTDAYIRPILYKSGTEIGILCNKMPDDFLVFAIPFGAYLDTSKGLSVKVSSWRHLEDNMIPMRAKCNGAYAGAALAKNDAANDGYGEAIYLTSDGHVSEGTGENLFIVRNGKLITSPCTADILEGITRATVVTLAKEELGLEVEERQIDRTELYICDEAFFTGTAAEVSPITSIDHRPVGNGQVGPLSKSLQTLFFDVVKGRNPKYKHWLTPVY